MEADEAQQALAFGPLQDHGGACLGLEGERDEAGDDPAPGDLAKRGEVGGRATVGGAGGLRDERRTQDGDADLEPGAPVESSGRIEPITYERAGMERRLCYAVLAMRIGAALELRERRWRDRRRKEGF